MKNLFIALMMVTGLIGSNAFAGNGYAASVSAISAILTHPEVEKAAEPLFIESVKSFGSFTNSKMIYIVRLAGEDAMDTDKFCLVVLVEGHLANESKVVSIQKWVDNSKLCHE